MNEKGQVEALWKYRNAKEKFDFSTERCTYKN